MVLGSRQDNVSLMLPPSLSSETCSRTKNAIPQTVIMVEYCTERILSFFSIRITVNVQLTKEEIQQAAAIIKEAAEHVMA